MLRGAGVVPAFILVHLFRLSLHLTRAAQSGWAGEGGEV
jgi:hypothetical protein